MNPRVFASILFLGAIAFACGPHPRTADATSQQPAAARKTSPDEKPLATTLDVKVAPVTPAAGESGDSASANVRFVLHVTNTTTKRVEINFPDGRTHDFAVLDSAGREVWRWSRGRMFTQGVQNRLLGSGETITYEDSWTGTPPQGRLTAVAILNSTNFHREKRVEFTRP
jgi:hypothetical protein